MIWSYIILSYVTLFLYGMADNLRGPLLPELIQYFSLTNTQGSLVFALSSCFAFVASYKSGSLMHRVGITRALMVAVFAMAFGYLIVGSAPNYIVVLCGITFLGVSMGLLGVIQNVMVSLGATENVRSQYMAGLQSMYGLSSFLAPLIVTFSYQHLSGWRSAFLLVSGFAFLILAATLFSHLKNPPKEPILEKPPKDRESDLVSWLAGFVVGSYVVAEVVVSSRLAQFTREAHGANLEQSNTYVSWFFLMLLGGRVFFALVPLRFTRSKILGVSLFLSVLCCVLGVQYNPWFLSLAGLTMSVFYPFALTYITEKFGAHAFNAIAKAVTLQGLFVIIMHVCVGYLTDLMGIQKAMYFGIIFLFFSGLALFLCDRWLTKKAAV